jgi:hypothetical protein
MGVVEDPVADGVRQGGVGEIVMPLGRRELAGDYVESLVKLLVIGERGDGQ